MNRRNTLIFIAIIFFLFIAVVFVVLFVQKSVQNNQVANQPVPEKIVFSTPTAAVSPVPTTAALSPFDVAKNFYSWYIFYKGNPLTTGAYKTSDYLSDDYKKKIESLISGPNPLNDDPVFCASNKTVNFALSRIYYNDQKDKATVNILKYNGEGDSIYSVNLQNVDNRWLITDIACVMKP